MLSLNRHLAAEQTNQRLAAARTARTARAAAPIGGDDAAHAVTIRVAREDDVPALADLAALDGRRIDHHPVLVAEIDGRLAAARDHDGHAVADPFRPTAALLDLLAVRARQITA
jgi:hypothetical protein